MDRGDAQLVSRARGALLGLVAGNQLGVPTEHLGTPDAIRKAFPNGLRDLAAPPKTSPYDDDAAMALLLGESLLACQGFDAADLRPGSNAYVPQTRALGNSSCPSGSLSQAVSCLAATGSFPQSAQRRNRLNCSRLSMSRVTRTVRRTGRRTGSVTRMRLTWRLGSSCARKRRPSCSSSVISLPASSIARTETDEPCSARPQAAAMPRSRRAAARAIPAEPCRIVKIEAAAAPCRKTIVAASAQERSSSRRVPLKRA